MSNDHPDFKDPFLDKLIKFSTEQQFTAKQKIQHPDPHVEAMAQLDNGTFRKASVLIPVIKPSHARLSHIVLTVRSNDLNSHAGQVSLPGGSREAHDADDIDTALRESEEEIGLDPKSVEIIGQLGEIHLPTGFKVTPVIGLIEPEPQLIPCPIEVEQIFMAPTSLLLDSAAYKTITQTYKGREHQTMELYFGEYRIWGATAAILHHLASQIAS